MPRRLVALLATASLSLPLAACSAPAAVPPAANSATAAPAGSTQIEDNEGKKTIASRQRIVALDNRSFRLLDSWGVPLVAGARKLMAPTVGYAKNDAIVDIGNHREPNLEAVVAAKPDLVISGQRFTPKNGEIAKLVPNATLIDASPRPGQDFTAEIKRHTTVVGEAVGKPAEASKAIADLDAAIARTKKAYNSEQKVLGVITSGGEINYSAPKSGRGVGPIFEMAGLTPALDVQQSSSNHEGDDVSVEAIAQANPDWIIVMDRDAATSAAKEANYKPAHELLTNSAALKNVKAVQQGRVLYMPQYSYIDESITTYTEVLNTLADALEKA